MNISTTNENVWLNIILIKCLKKGIIGITLEDDNSNTVIPSPGSLLRTAGGSSFLVINKPEHKPFVVIRPRDHSELLGDRIELVIG